MKQLLDKATTAFTELAQKLNATIIMNSIRVSHGNCELSFDKNQASTETLYLWDRKHGISDIDWKWSGPNIGWTILQSSVKEEDTRFSYLAIHNSSDNTLKVYPATMKDVKMWRAYGDMRSFDDYDNHITSYCGIAGI